MGACKRDWDLRPACLFNASGKPNRVGLSRIPGTSRNRKSADSGCGRCIVVSGLACQKKVRVLSGGERARLCMAGLLLGDYNILVLDEPGNHLDVETVEALANALLAYEGTVIFTSHDRHFMSRIATNIIEVRDGCARNYIGDYESYLYSINKEIDDGERETGNKTKFSPASNSVLKAKKPSQDKDVQKRHRKRQKEIKNIEKKVAELDAEKKSVHQQLLDATDPSEALRLHDEFTQVSEKLEKAEERWLELTEA